MEKYEAIPIVNERNFDEMLMAGNPMIVLIYASWCPFCRRFLPVFTQFSQGMKERCFIVQDDRETIADRYQVNVVPTVLFFENGKVSKRLDGVMGMGLSEKQLAEFVRVCNLSAG